MTNFEEQERDFTYVKSTAGCYGCQALQPWKQHKQHLIDASAETSRIIRFVKCPVYTPNRRFSICYYNYGKINICVEKYAQYLIIFLLITFNIALHRRWIDTSNDVTTDTMLRSLFLRPLKTCDVITYVVLWAQQ